jgi:hypothetical protein
MAPLKRPLSLSKNEKRDIEETIALWWPSLLPGTIDPPRKPPLWDAIRNRIEQQMKQDQRLDHAELYGSLFSTGLLNRHSRFPW